MAYRRSTQQNNRVSLPKMEESKEILGKHGSPGGSPNYSRAIRNKADTFYATNKQTVMPLKLNPEPTNDHQESSDMLQIEDYDVNSDPIFVNEHLVPYLRDLYKDLMMRSSNPNNLDKVTFIEYTKMPGIINDRLHYMFCSAKSTGNSPNSSPK